MNRENSPLELTWMLGNFNFFVKLCAAESRFHACSDSVKVSIQVGSSCIFTPPTITTIPATPSNSSGAILTLVILLCVLMDIFDRCNSLGSRITRF
jgi:hypothetical protein